jgi:hypothetical protein
MKKNVSDGERLLSLALSLVFLPKSRTGKVLGLGRAALSLGLAARAASGQCAVYKKLGINSADKKAPRKPMGPKTILVNHKPAYLQSFAIEKLRGRDDGSFRLTIDGQDWDFSLRPNPGDERSILEIRRVQYRTPALIEQFAEKMHLMDSEQSAMLILRKLRAYLETGEIPSIQGQPHGQRSPLGQTLSQDVDRAPRRVRALRPVRTVRSHPKELRA